jgi:hypothetical protein
LTVVFLIIAILSLLFNGVQYLWRRQDRKDHAAEKDDRDRREEEKEAEHRRREEAPPEFFNFDGSPAPIRIGGRNHLMQQPLIDLGSNVTVVNPTNSPVKISLLRFVLDGEELPLHDFYFCDKTNHMNKFKRVSLRGNDKHDYEMHFIFPDNDCPGPPSRDGEIWLSSSNRNEPVRVPVRCP